jgi:hypothetical protein
MEPLSVFFFVLWEIGSLVTITVGTVMTYRQRRDEKILVHQKMITPLRFVLQQCFLTIKHPYEVSLLFGAIILFGPLSLCFIFIGNVFDLRQLRRNDELKKMNEHFRNKTGMEWRIISDRDAEAFDRWMVLLDADEKNQYELAERLMAVLAKAGSFVFLVFNLLIAPVLFKPARAQGDKEREDQAISKPVPAEPFNLPLPAELVIKGVLAGELALDPESGQVSPALRQVDLKFIGRIDPQLSTFLKLNGVALTKQKDPFQFAWGTWTPLPSLTLSAGRIVNPIGQFRQDGPDAKTEITYPVLPLLPNFTDHGVMAKYSPAQRLSIDVSLTSGLGPIFAPIAFPDLVVRSEIRPREILTFGLAGATGKRDNKWYVSLTSYSGLCLKHLQLQAEVLANLPIGDNLNRTSAGAWLLLQGTFHETLEPYARFTVSDDDLQDDRSGVSDLLLGLNWRFLKNAMLRLGLGLPLAPAPSPHPQLALQVQF